MDIMAIVFILMLDTLYVRAYYINMKSCRRCSNRVDVPCYIQELDFHCLHDEFGGIWPGLPKNLRSKKVLIDNEELTANFTWNGPYDASYQVLNGFLLTLNIAQDYITPDFHISRLQEPPRCFFANLSGTNWDTVDQPHSVVFYFDCVTARADDLVEVSVSLRSSPVPGEKSFKPLTTSITLRRDPEPYIITTNFTINLTVVGSVIRIKFGPLKPNATYRVCLATIAEEYLCYRDVKTREGQDEVVFDDVQTNTYRVYVQRGDNPDNPMYTSKSFNVTVTPVSQEEETIAPSVVAIITVACLLFVAGATTLCFCLMRERCHCLLLHCDACNCNKYVPPGTSVPNNTNEEEDDSVLEILPLFYEESDDFISAVGKVSTYLNRWTNCKINPHWLSGCHSNQSMPFMDKHPHGVLMIVISYKMWQLLDDVFYTTKVQNLTDPKSKLFRKVLMETDGKPYSRFIVSLHPLTDTGKHLKGIEIFQMTKYGVSQNRNTLEINTEDLYLMLKMLTDEGNVRPGWAAYEELSMIQTAVKYVRESDVFIDHRTSGHDNYDSIRIDTRLADCDHFTAPDMDQNIESISMCQDMELTGVNFHDFVLDTANRFTEPKEDTESISWSAIGQKQFEIYQDYKASRLDSNV